MADRVYIKTVGPPVGGYVGEAWENPVREGEVPYVREDQSEIASLRAHPEARNSRLEEAARILRDVLDSDDFQPQFSQRQHMSGPALRGCIERAAAEIDAACEAGD